MMRLHVADVRECAITPSGRELARISHRKLRKPSRRRTGPVTGRNGGGAPTGGATDRTGHGPEWVRRAHGTRCYLTSFRDTGGRPPWPRFWVWLGLWGD